MDDRLYDVGLLAIMVVVGFTSGIAVGHMMLPLLGY
jgi:hypothetical protein